MVAGLTGGQEVQVAWRVGDSNVNFASLNPVTIDHVAKLRMDGVDLRGGESSRRLP